MCPQIYSVTTSLERDLMQSMPIVVFSHLRWNFVFQRPQHLLSRFARRQRIFFIEEPLAADDAYWELHQPQENILVCRPHTPARAGGFSDAEMPFLRRLLSELERTQHIG